MNEKMLKLNMKTNQRTVNPNVFDILKQNCTIKPIVKWMGDLAHISKNCVVGGDLFSIHKNCQKTVLY